MSLNRQVLLLNASFEPLTICSARRALKLVFKGAAVVQNVSAYTVKTATINIPVPSVIRLVSYRRVPRLNRSVSRKGIMLRDGGCQYCGAKLAAKALTLDHVVPRSKGGESTWENMVASCFPCNNLKGSRTPQEAGMTLAKVPRQLTIHAKHRMLAGSDDKSWDAYLFA